MDLQEIKKDIKGMHVSKNVVIVCLVVALVIVSMAAFCLSERGERGGRYERGGYGMMQGRGYGYDNYGPGYYGMMKGQAIPPVDGSVKIQTTPTTTNAPAAGQSVVPKAQ